ncbi:MAG TPA: response regulator [Bacilli bacterium]
MIQLLIVDDEPHVVDRLANTIDWPSMGVEGVHTAYSGEEALNILSVNHMDIVITDIQMPGISGLDLIREIGKRWKAIKCVLLSGHAEFAYAQEAIRQGVDDYILKPVTVENLLNVVAKVIADLRLEWEERVSQQRIEQTLRENLPLLRGNLLDDLLKGRQYAETTLREKLRLLELRFSLNETCTLMMIRLDNDFTDYDFHNRSLIEYAIGNIAEEIFGGNFLVWHCKDAHDYLVFLLSPNPDSGRGNLNVRHELQRASTQLQAAVKNYLKGNISISLSREGFFPRDIVKMYNSCISAMRQHIGNEHELIMTVSDEMEQVEIQTLNSLYELPTLTQLLEAGRWDDSVGKLKQIFKELGEKGTQSVELPLEVFFAISAAFAHITHKNGLSLSSVTGLANDNWFQEYPFRSLEQLEKWSMRVLNHLKDHMDQETKDSRKRIIHEVREFVEQNLAKDVSLQAIADHVHMHPVYISKIYKSETGQKLSDFVYQYRMEMASYLLAHTSHKIYEIAEMVGYQRAHSFIHVFKKHYGVTPQEYREQRIGLDVAPPKK